jgi:hypothetical protein
LYSRIYWIALSNVFLFLADASYEGAAGVGAGGGLRGIDFSNLGDAELQNLLNNMSQQQLMQVRSFYQTVKTGVMV